MLSATTSVPGDSRGSNSSSTKTCVHVLGALLLLGGSTLLLSGSALLLSGSTLLLVGTSLPLVASITITIALLGKGSSEDCGGEKRGDEDVLHGECNMSDQPNWILSA